MEINIVKILYVTATGNKDLSTCLKGGVLGSFISRESSARVTLMV